MQTPAFLRLITPLMLALLASCGDSRTKTPTELPEIVLGDPDPLVAKAIAAARREVEQSRASSAAWGQLGMVLFAHSLQQPALKCFTEAASLDASEPRWPYFQGLCQLAQQPDEAIAAFRRAVQAAETSEVTPRLRLAETLLLQGSLPEAEEEYALVVEQEPGNGRAHLGLARVASMRGDWKKCRADLASALKDRCTSQPAHRLMAEVEMRLGDRAAALAHRQQSQAKADESCPEPWLDATRELQTGKKAMLIRANVADEEGRFGEAISVARQITRTYPDFDSGWIILGKAQVHSGDPQAGQHALWRAAELTPESVEAQFYLGYAASLRRDFEEAKSYYQAALKLKPDFTNAHYNLADVLRTTGDINGAIAEFRASLNCEPNAVDARVELAELLLKAGARDEAERHLRTALKLNPEDAKAQRLLAEFSEDHSS